MTAHNSLLTVVVALLLGRASAFRPAWNSAAALRNHRIHKKRVLSTERATAERDGRVASNIDKLHFVVSTGCTAYQHWQSEVLKASLWRFHRGSDLTHIVVGCEQQQASGEQQVHTSAGGDSDRTVAHEMWEKSTHPKARVFFVPAVQQALEFPW